MKRTLTGFSTVIALCFQATMPLAAQSWNQRPAPQPAPDRPTPLPTPERPAVQPPRPTNPGWGNQNRGYAGRIRCETKKNDTKRCSVRTENRVVLMTRHGGTCTQGRTWGFTRSTIWVAGKCRATFLYGYGNDWGNGNGNGWGNGNGDGWSGGNRPQPPKDKDDGPSAGLIIGGVAVAAGLVALLASKNKKKPEEAATTTPEPEPETPTTYPPGPPASVSADMSMVPADSRPSMQTCLFEASRQIGVTGGTKLKLDRLVNVEPGNGGWRFRTELTATYPDGDRQLPMYCRATPTKVVQLDFTAG